MKRILSISTLIIAAILFVAMTAIPHHHHKSVMCLVVEHCERQADYSQDGAGEEAAQHSGQNGNCAADSDYLFISKSIKGNGAGLSGSSHHLLNLPLLCLLINTLTDLSQSEPSGTPYGEYIVYYQSAFIISSGGLRAPPSLSI